MRGLAFEGGGARGSYHIGVIKAFCEAGYEFDGYVGTSIGAVNAAAMAQGDLALAVHLWENMTMDQLFDMDEQALLTLTKLSVLRRDKQITNNIKDAVTKIIDNKGMSMEKMRIFLGTYLDEEKIRASGKDFGLVTVSLSERKAYELMLEDIPAGQLKSYILASSSLPGFRGERIDDKTFLDGAFYNNCPINLLLDRGYDEVIAVRTNALGIVRKVEDDTRVKSISPREDIGNTLWFSPENSARNIRLGFLDGKRHLDGLRGYAYYIAAPGEEECMRRLVLLGDEVIREIGAVLDIADMPPTRMLLEKIVPQVASYLQLEKGFDYVDFIVALLEREARRRRVERHAVYDFQTLCAKIKKAKESHEEMPLLLSKRRRATEMLAKRLLW